MAGKNQAEHENILISHRPWTKMTRRLTPRTKTHLVVEFERLKAVAE
jgi:hypothetical protein